MIVLCLNAGSSSLKYALYDLSGSTERCIDERTLPLENTLFDDLRSRDVAPDAIAHRIVFGGPDHRTPAVVTPQLIATLQALVPYDALHLQPALALIERAGNAFPNATQTASFDTAFHRNMPAVSRLLPIPRDIDPLVQRYGFHGISYEYIVSALGEDVRGKVVVAHLGAGASLAALRDGEPVDTTMGFSPLGGLMMGTRPGDLDPGVVTFLLRSCDDDYRALVDLLYHRSGLQGVSAQTSDMRTLVDACERDVAAAQAVGLFVHTARKWIAAMTAALGGIDRLVFTGGIGEHSAPVRALIALGLAYLGIELDARANAQHERVISTSTSAVHVLIVPTNENLILARHAKVLLESK